MRQEDMDLLLKKIETSARDVPIPERLEPEVMIKKLEARGRGRDNQERNNHKNRRKWRRPAEYGVLAAAALVMILAVAQMKNTGIFIEPGEIGIAATEAALSNKEQSGNTAEVPENAAGEAVPNINDTGEAVIENDPETPEEKQYAAKSYKEIYEKIKVFRNDDYSRNEMARDGAAAPTGAAPDSSMAGAAPESAMDGGVSEKLMAGVSAGTGIAAEGGAGIKKELESGAKEFSNTNVQVEGVDEGDIVKTDGTYLYIMSSDSGRIQIVEAGGRNPKRRGTIADTSTTEESRSIQDFYINGDILSVIRQAYVPYEEVWERDGYRSIRDSVGLSDGMTGGVTAKYRYAYPAKSVTYLETYNIADRDYPKLLGTVTQDGTYKSSRRVDDYIYLFTSYYAYSIKDMKTTEGYIPVVNGKTLPYDSIYIPEHVDNAGYMVIASIDMKHPGKTVSEKAVLADGETFYVSASNIYIGATRYDGRAEQYDYTEMMKLSYKNGKITFKAHGNVDGYLNDQFSMDEYQGRLRLVSTLSYNSGNSTNSLMVLDENLKVIGEIEDLAPGEQIYSARFMGTTGYFVTFRNMDPLFSVDLTDPKKPKILGELKITGFSEYLHPYEEDLLLGIGREINPSTGNFKGLKLSMFDISDPKDVTEIQKLVEKSYEYSPAWDNHKAVSVSSGKHIIGFAVEEYDKTSRTWNYKYVVYAYDKYQGFKEVLSYKLQDDYHYENVRGLYIGQYFYVVESSRVTVFDMKRFEKAGQVGY